MSLWKAEEELRSGRRKRTSVDFFDTYRENVCALLTVAKVCAELEGARGSPLLNDFGEYLALTFSDVREPAPAFAGAA